MFLKINGISDLMFVVPRVQHFLPGVVIHHGVVAKLIGELYVWVPLFSSLRVVSEIDCSGSTVVIVNGVDYSTSNKRILQRVHAVCDTINKEVNKKTANSNEALTTLICGLTHNFKQ